MLYTLSVRRKAEDGGDKPAAPTRERLDRALSRIPGELRRAG
jgi:hypothetical protein